MSQEINGHTVFQDFNDQLDAFRKSDAERDALIRVSHISLLRFSICLFVICTSLTVDVGNTPGMSRLRRTAT